MNRAEALGMLKPYRILVTGSRRCTEDQAAEVRYRLNAAVDDVGIDGRPIVVVHGKCPYGGVDLAAHRWAESAPVPRVEPEPHPAAWDVHGRAAGMIRNAEMVKLGASLCLAFPAKGSRGTWDCIRKAADAGIPVQVWPLR